MNLWRPALSLSALLAAGVRGQVIDDFQGPLAWKALPSDGVVATAAVEKAPDGASDLRIDYDFTKGMGFVVVRHELDLAVPENYRFSFRVRGEGPRNNFEFKLIAAKPDGRGGVAAGDDVWWVNNRAYDWPRQWRRVAYRNRHVSFAWGPSGGKDGLKRVGAIEFAVAAAEGGKGSVWIDDLKLEPTAPAGAVKTTVTSEGLGGVAPRILEANLPGELGQGLFWMTPPIPWSLTVGYPSPAEVGAVEVLSPGGRIELEASEDGTTWKPAGVRRVASGRTWIRTPGLEAVALRVRSTSPPPAGDSRPCMLRVFGPGPGEDMNQMLRAIAAEAPRGLTPRGIHDEATSWTVVGLPDAEHEALLSADGQVELSKGGFSLEPFVQLDLGGGFTQWVTWADASIQHRLTQSASPVVSWSFTDAPDRDPLTLTIEPTPCGTPEKPAVAVKYTLAGATTPGAEARLVIAVRPIQVLPPSQWLNVTGGFAPIRTLERRSSPTPALVVNDGYPIVPLAEGCDLVVGDGSHGEFAGAAWGALLDRDAPATNAGRIEDPDGLAWGVIATPWRRQTTGSPTVLSLAAPLREMKPDDPAAILDQAARRGEAAEEAFREATNRVTLNVPPTASALEETWRSQQRLIMINADGPALQPGSRTYERAWIRDGASLGTAMCFTGHADMMRRFVDWYGPFQYENGKVPCVVDHRGPDPVPEHDSHGEYIHAVATVYRFTQDRAFLDRHWPRVMKAVTYIDSLVAERSTDEYGPGSTSVFEDGGGKVPRRAAFGLVPQSISHEGYSAKPMHSYWDDFWTARGLKDAAFIAGELGRPEKPAYEARALAMRKAIAASVATAFNTLDINYVPGCVELGDFDATSTAIAVWPTQEWSTKEGISRALFEATFERYWTHFTKRRADKIEWRDYTPYEVRIIGAMLRLGENDARWRARAHELDRWFLDDQRPRGWRQWGEVVYRDKNFAGFIGDYPHTWVGADYLNSVRAMFLDERDAGELVLGLGISGEWLDEAADRGVGIRRAPTWWGTISYTVRREPGGVLRWLIVPEMRRGAEVSTLTLVAPKFAREARVVRGAAEVKERTDGAVKLGGPFTAEIEVEIRE